MTDIFKYISRFNKKSERFEMPDHGVSRRVCLPYKYFYIIFGIEIGLRFL